MDLLGDATLLGTYSRPVVLIFSGGLPFKLGLWLPAAAAAAAPGFTECSGLYARACRTLVRAAFSCRLQHGFSHLLDDSLQRQSAKARDMKPWIAA